MEHKTFAFISYSRKDAEIALYIQKRIENYVFPQDLVSQENRPNDAKYVRHIFLDLTDLSTTASDFNDEIKENIREAKYLILIWSSNSADSEYVRKEIKYFLETHDNDTDKIVAVYVDKIFTSGVPEIDHIEMTRNCPIYYTSKGDAGHAGRRYCYFHILEFLLKVDFNLLYNRYEAYKKRIKKIRFWSAFAFFAIVFICMAISIFSLKKSRDAHAEAGRLAIEKSKSDSIAVIAEKAKSMESEKRALAESQRANAERDKAQEERKRANAEKKVAQEEKEKTAVATSLAIFEKKTFPYSLVVGYVKNFLEPLMAILEEKYNQQEHVLIFMPYSYDELSDKKRIDNYKDLFEKRYNFSSLNTITYPIKGRERGASITKLEMSDFDYPLFMDNANTIIAFKAVIDYKLNTKNNPLHIPNTEENRDRMVREYTDEFIDCMMNQFEMNKYRQKIHFIRTKEDCSNVLDMLFD